MDEFRTWAQKHAYVDTNYSISALAARKSMPRQRVEQAKPGQGKQRSREKPQNLPLSRKIVQHADEIKVQRAKAKEILDEYGFDEEMQQEMLCQQ